MPAGGRAPDWYRIDGQNLFWDGHQWLDKAGRVVSGPDFENEAAATAAAASTTTVTQHSPRHVPAWPFVLGAVSFIAGLLLLFLPAGQQQADNLDLIGAAHTVFIQYIGGLLLAVNGFVWLAAGSIIAYVRPPHA